MTELFLLLLLNSGVTLFYIIWFGMIKPETPMRSKRVLFEWLLLNSFLVVVGIGGVLFFVGIYTVYQAIERFLKLPWEEK
jgi:hypothetical protein